MKLVMSITALAMGIAYFLATRDLRVPPFGDPSGPRAFPYLLSALLLVASVVLFFEWLTDESRQPISSYRIGFWPLVPVSAWMVLYVLVFETLGFIASTIIFLLPLTSIFNAGKHIANVATSILLPLVVYALLKGLLSAPLPVGIFFSA